MYSPFVHHVVQPQEAHSPFAHAYGSKCVAAAISAVWTAQELDNRGMLDEAWCLTVDVLAMAATTLLVVGLGSPLESTTHAVRESSSAAKALLEKLASRNASAARCLESLAVSWIHTREPDHLLMIPNADRTSSLYIAVPPHRHRPTTQPNQQPTTTAQPQYSKM